MSVTGAALAGFDAWDAESYLAHYYGRVEADEAATLAFITKACRRIVAPVRALAFGIGPTVHHLMPLAPYTRELHVADYLDSNLDHVARWLERDARAHDWRPFCRHVLECEGVRQPSETQVGDRERMVRDRVTRRMRCDAGMASPLSMPGLAQYDLVLSCFCAESATGELDVWRNYVRNILRLLAPGGLFITAALRRCRGYQIGRHRFACADIDEDDLVAALIESGIELGRVHVEVEQVGLHERLGYDSIVLATAVMTEPAVAVARAA